MKSKLRITRYNKTRYWAIWANEELLAVTVYRKGAQAILNHINNTQQQTRHNTTMTKAKSVNAAAAPATNTADFAPTIIKAVNGAGKTIRIKFDPLGVSVCYNLKGKWQADEIYNEPLPQLVAEGIFTIEDEKSQKTYDKYFNSGKKSKGKRSKSKRSKPKKAKKQSSAVEEAPQTNELVAADEAAEEAAIWLEIEEAREQERFMEAQDAATEQELQYEEQQEPLQETKEVEEEPSAAAPAEPQASKLHKTCNVVLNGEEHAHAIPEGYVPAAGDRLIRNYKSEVVEVVVKAKGQYEWNGEIYPTLTHISWKVAGYQISGNTFFGLPIKPRKG